MASVMSKITRKSIFGSGGGGKGGGGAPRAPVESPNTLTSTAYARVIDLVAEGEIGGLVDDLKSIYFDETPIMNPDGSVNFEGFTIQEAVGHSDQTYPAGFESVETEVVVGVQVENGSPITRQITNENLTSVRVTIRIPRLFFQNASNGDITYQSVRFQISLQADGGGFSVVHDITIHGKTMSPYEVAYLVQLEGDPPWDIRVTRVSADSTSSNVENETYWARYTEIVDEKLAYPYSAYYAISIDSSQFGNLIPRRAYLIHGRKIQIPSNYDVETREYTGVWDLTFAVEREVCDNPAWVLYDIITDNMAGLGEFIPVSKIDKASFYEAAQYCDELVDDGFGGTEPRHTFNIWHAARSNAYETLQQIAASFQASLYWAGDTLRLVIDKPRDPIKIINNSNIIDGEFVYQNSGLKDRHTVFMVGYNNPDDFYRGDYEVYEDPDLIERHGYRELRVELLGCVVRGQAARYARWLKEIEAQKDVVSFVTSWENADLLPGDIFYLYDKDYAGLQRSGRIVSGSTTQINLDRNVTLSSSYDYTFYVLLPDGSIAEGTPDQESGTYATITFATPLSGTPMANASWVLSGTDVSPRQFRVLSIKENDKHLFEISAVFHDPDRYARVEEGLVIDSPSYTILTSGTLLPPTNLSYQEYLYKIGNAVLPGALISWQTSLDPRATFYELQMKGPGDTVYTGLSDVYGSSYDLKEAFAGIYSFRVRARDTYTNRVSAWLELTDRNLFGLQAAPSDVTNFKANILGNEMFLTWDPVADLDLSYYQIRFAPVGSNADYDSALTLIPSIPAGQNSVIVANLQGSYYIKAYDLSGIASENPAIIVNAAVNLSQLNAVETFQEHPDWDGLKFNVEYDGVNDGIRLVDDGSAVESYGRYRFLNVVDLGQVYTSRVTAVVLSGAFSISDDLFSYGDIFALSDIFGSSLGDASIRLRVRTSNDISIDYLTAAMTAAAPDFWWTLQSDNSEEGGHTTGTSGSVSYDASSAGYGVVNAADFTSGTLTPNSDADIENSTLSERTYWFILYRPVGVTDPSGSIWSEGNATHAVQIFLDSDGFVGFRTWESGSPEVNVLSSTAINEGTFAVVTIVYSVANDYVRIYINDTQSVEQTSITTLPARGAAAVLGGNGTMPSSGQPTGNAAVDVAHFALWNSVLSASTQENLFEAVGGEDHFGDWNPFLTGDYTTRYYEFDMELFSNTSTVTPFVEGVTITIDMPDRVEGEDDVLCPAVGKSITFTPPFRVRPAINITAEDLQTGDYWVITGQSRTGFSITFYDNTDSAIERTFDWIARGYGYEQV